MTTTTYVDDMGGLLTVEVDGSGHYNAGADGITNLTAELVAMNLADAEMGFVRAVQA